MKRLLIAVAILAASTEVASAAAVRGYVRKDGTYVAPHYRSNPNSTVYDNYSAKGNVNPYTGRAGTVSPTPSYGYTPPAYTRPSYSSPSYTAPRYTAPSYGSSYTQRRSVSPYGSSFDAGGED